MRQSRKKPGESLLKRLLRGFAIAVCILAFALFMDWLIFNWFLGCCEGGVCWPDIYPQCRNEHYQEFYGEGYDNK